MEPDIRPLRIVWKRSLKSTELAFLCASGRGGGRRATPPSPNQPTGLRSYVAFLNDGASTMPVCGTNFLSMTFMNTDEMFERLATPGPGWNVSFTPQCVSQSWMFSTCARTQSRVRFFPHDSMDSMVSRAATPVSASHGL